MAKSRIQNLKPPCDYNLAGIEAILLLDFADFGGFRFEGGNLYDVAKVVAILRTAEFTELEAKEGARYGSTISGKIYAHSLQSFVSKMSADMISNLHLAKKRRYIPVFRLRSGALFTFGFDAGAKITYQGQTEEAAGFAVNIAAASIYPLFEVTEAALTASYGVGYSPDFLNGAYCEII